MPRPVPAPAILAFGLCAALAACVMPGTEKLPTGEQDFVAFCSSCHGVTGVGNGEMAATLPHKPANLTTLAARNKGEFPATRVMAKIWGYTGARKGAVMPGFGPLLEGDLVPYDGGDGIMTPTPIRLVQLAEYVKGIQAP